MSEPRLSAKQKEARCFADTARVAHPKNNTIAIEQETILAFRALILPQSPTFLGSNWGDLVLGAIVVVLKPKVAVLRAIAVVPNSEIAVSRAIVAVPNRKCRDSNET